MALKNGRNELSNVPLIYLSPRAKDKAGNKVAPHFEISRKNEAGKIERTDETCTDVDGDLVRVQFKEREWQGQMMKHVVFYLRDPVANEMYHLDLTYRIATRALFNAIISLESPKGLSIGIWENKRGYDCLSLRQHNELVPWKYDGRKGEIPEPVTVKFKGKEMRDFTATDEFFENELKLWVAGVLNTQQEETPAKNDPLPEDPMGLGAEEEEVIPAPEPAPAKVAAPVKAASPAAKVTTPVQKTVPVAATKPAARPVAKTAPPPSDPAPEESDESAPF